MESAEQALIATISSHPNKSESQEILLELSAEHFEGIGEGNLWTAMRELVLAGNPINETTIRQSLGTLGHLGPEGIYWPTYKAMLVKSDEPAEPLANEVRDAWMRRSLSAILGLQSSELSNMAVGASEIAGRIQEDISRLIVGHGKDEDPWAELATKIERGESMESIVRQGGWWFDSFNEAYPIPRGAVTFVVARLNQGKSLCGLSIARATVERDETALWVNSDMPEGMMKVKLLSCFAGVPQWRIQKNCMTADQNAAVRAAIELLRAKLSFLHFPGMTPLDKMKPKIISTIRKRNPSLLVWDQFSQIGKDKSTGKRDDVQAAYISRSIKNIAASTDVAVLMLAQANRGAGMGEPSVLDIAETDAIGQDACGVITLWSNEDRAKKAEMAGEIDFGTSIKTSEKFKNVPYLDCRLAKSQITEAGKVFHLFRDGEHNIIRPHALET